MGNQRGRVREPWIVHDGLARAGLEVVGRAALDDVRVAGKVGVGESVLDRGPRQAPDPPGAGQAAVAAIPAREQTAHAFTEG